MRVSKAHRQQPALLRTSRQLREEGLKIFYSENTFDLHIRDLRYALPTYHWLQMNTLKGNIVLAGSCNWTNLQDWMRQFHSRETNFRPVGESTIPQSRTLIALFDIAEALRAIPWNQAAKAVKKTQQLMRERHGRWVWD